MKPAQILRQMGFKHNYTLRKRRERDRVGDCALCGQRIQYHDSGAHCTNCLAVFKRLASGRLDYVGRLIRSA